MRLRGAAAAAATTDDIEAAPTLDSLPPEVLGVAFCFSQPLDMMPLTECSRQWRDMDLDTTYWKPVFLKDFSSPPRHWSEDDSLRARTDRLLHEADRRDPCHFFGFFLLCRTDRDAQRRRPRSRRCSARGGPNPFTSPIHAVCEVTVLMARRRQVSAAWTWTYPTRRGGDCGTTFLWQDLRARRAARKARRVQRQLQDARFPRRYNEPRSSEKTGFKCGFT